MREKLKTSLLALVFAGTVSAGFAAPSVRAIGGAGTVNSAANATAARSGSLRTTGPMVRPTATTTSLKNATTAATTTTATAPAATTTTAGAATVGRVATSPRLSIGKYIGGQKSTSTSNPSSELIQRLDKLESDVDKLDTEKQDSLQGSDYIKIEDNELVLDLDQIREDLNLRSGTDGREVEIITTDDGLLWRYAGETTTTPLIEWSQLKTRLSLGDDLTSAVTTLNERITNVNNDLAKKLDAKFDSSLEGKALVIDSEGNIVASGEFANANDVYTKDQVYSKDEVYGKGEVYNKDEVYSKDEVYKKDEVYTKGEVYGKGEVYNKEEVYDKGEVNAQLLGVNMDLAGKVDIYQGETNAGKPLIIDSAGNVTVAENEIPLLEDIGALAYKDTISNIDVDEATLERSKMAADITDTLNWIDEWRKTMPATDGDRYVFAVDENGDAGWFKVAE